ncbi:hypothetical protein [Paraurantiacibacter namhicola]|uniref:Uncharacterized protein n=1 Tax=Paraurantiacibacter namhicola TaxID=645517 RepID=A0A1C7D6B5_9SPHN|nr:hypothetical protein [Paraurantiacibacter namhicola]ANU07007.1 hypothetical protein A6F65_00685 [Paraurantiacibacter namhicola]
MADPALSITDEYVQNVLALVGCGISWPVAVSKSVQEQGLHPFDVTYVMTHGKVVETEKETADGANYVMIGRNCDEVQIRVEFWLDPNHFDVRILTVQRI